MSSIEDLVRAGSIHSFQASREEIARAIGLAKRDLDEAEQSISLDWTFSIAYNAVLQAARAYMFKMGYRPASAEAHKTTFEFMGISVDEPMRKTIDYFDRARKKRHRVIYDEPGLITEKEAQQLLSKAKEFLEYVQSKL